MLINTKERAFEEFIEDYLVKNHGFIKRMPDNYDKESAIDKDMFYDFITNTQPKEWEKTFTRHGKKENAIDEIIKEVDLTIQEKGVAYALKNELNNRGAKLYLAYFKPSSKLNQETLKQYKSNKFSVIRQLKYSNKNENSIDMVLFLNGIPIITIELKNQLTNQNILNGMKQYKYDRDPREKLLQFKRCIAHFTVDCELAYMTTKLEAGNTHFLPFNKGTNNSAGNPAVDKKYKTHYMWEDILSPDTLLELINKFVRLYNERDADTGKEKEKMVFPRYHQLDTVRRLIEDAKANGTGENYLIQHSAGSGKTNTIAWTAHRLSELKDENDVSIFDSVIVLTDRKILDQQIRDVVKAFSETRGLVRAVENNSAELKDALEKGERIITSTLQKFPYVVDSISELKAKKFAVLIDEAHSSQSGESSKSLRMTLEVKESNGDLSLKYAETEDDDEDIDSTEDLVIKKQMKARKIKQDNVSFFAFTATPKTKTLELFGKKNAIDEKFYPFSLYSMKQAIEEGFILDVLKNYTTYQQYFSLYKKIEDDPKYDKRKAQMLLLKYVDKTEYAIRKKVEVICEHFDRVIKNRLQEQAKAMVVTRSRLHAVRFKLEIDRYLKERNCNYNAMVAFTGKVIDGGIEYTERGMNGVSESQTAQEFKKVDNKILVVAEKFQTGFDQPLLTVMYVDKRLGGVNAVQTLSRLNRTYNGDLKSDVFVIDFVNDAEEIEKSFQPYYETTILSEETNPNILYDLQRDLYDFKIYEEIDVIKFNDIIASQAKPDVVNSFLDDIVRRLNDYLEEEKEDFRDKIKNYINKYPFVAQIIDFEDIRLEKLFIFLKFLFRKLPYKEIYLPKEVLENVALESYKLIKKEEKTIKLEKENNELKPIMGTAKRLSEDDKEQLSVIIKEINDIFGADLTDKDRVLLNNLSETLRDNGDLVGAIKNNSRDNAKIKFNEVLSSELVNVINSNFDFYQKLENNKEMFMYIADRMYDYVAKKVEE